MPRVYEFANYGGPEVLKLVDAPAAAPGAGEIRVRNAIVSLNFIETYQRSGLYKADALPSRLGSSGAGTVEAVGDGVSDLAVGDRVVYATGPRGSYAESYVLPAGRAVKVPADLPLDVVGGTFLRGLTVQYLIRQTRDVKKGDTVLLHAAAGGLGQIAVQWLVALGARVIATAGSPEKVALAKKLGAWAGIDYSTEDVAARVRELTDGAGVPVVYDSVGKSTWEASLKSAAPLGLVVSFGNASGPVTGVDLGTLNVHGSLFVTRPNLAHYASTPAKLRAMADDYFAVLRSGAVRIDDLVRYKFEDAAQAHTDLAARKVVGSAVLVVDEAAAKAKA